MANETHLYGKRGLSTFAYLVQSLSPLGSKALQALAGGGPVRGVSGKHVYEQCVEVGQLHQGLTLRV